MVKLVHHFVGIKKMFYNNCIGMWMFVKIADPGYKNNSYTNCLFKKLQRKVLKVSTIWCSVEPEWERQFNLLFQCPMYNQAKCLAFSELLQGATDVGSPRCVVDGSLWHTTIRSLCWVWKQLSGPRTGPKRTSLKLKQTVLEFYHGLRKHHIHTYTVQCKTRRPVQLGPISNILP